MTQLEKAAETVSERLLFTADLAQVLFEHNPDAILIVGEDGLIAAANRQAALLTMYPSSELIGMLVDEMLPDDVRGNHPAHRNGFFADARIRPMGVGLDLRLRRRNGADVPVDVNLSPVMLVQGTYVIATIRRRRAA